MAGPSEHAALIIEPGGLRLADLRRIARAPVTLILAESDRNAIAASAAIVARIVREGATVYGVNTGFG
ncbi:MAG TPA: aromatic amino acid lyase, partial [Stellaceae bacterium]|nr:aromatic amino acid lyase [Stellaceae bacterium]